MDDRKKEKEPTDKEPTAKEAESKKSVKEPAAIANSKKDTLNDCSSATNMSESDSNSSNMLNDGSKSGASAKRKVMAAQLDSDDNNISMPAKRTKHENESSDSSSTGITEEAVRRYLMRKPMTTTELLTKFKKSNVSNDKLVVAITQILKKINPDKQMIQKKLYLSINPNANKK